MCECFETSLCVCKSVSDWMIERCELFMVFKCIFIDSSFYSSTYLSHREIENGRIAMRSNEMQLRLHEFPWRSKPSPF